MDTPQEPRWLDAGEQQTWLALASVLMRLPAALDAQLQRDAGISHFEYQVMAGLSMSAERTLRMSVLAALAEGSLPRLSQVVGRLEKRGWVRRTPDPPTAATPWRSSPRKAGPRSRRPRPGTSRRSAAWCLTH